MFSRMGTNTGPKRPPPPPPPNAAPGLAMNEADLFQHSAASWQRSPNRDMWAACHGANSALPSYTYAYFGPAPTPTPVAFAPARVPAWQQAAETAAERASVDRSPGNGSRTRAIAHCAAPSGGVPKSIQRSARAAEAAYRAYYAATGGGGMHSGRAPSPFGPVSPPVKRRIKRPAPPAPSAPKAHVPTDAGLRTALLHTVEQRCASQQEASVTLAESKKRPRERPSDDDALKDERVVVWNRVTGKTLTGQAAPRLCDLARYLSQHPELAVLRGDLSVAGSGSNSDEEIEVASREVISEDLERTTREVISDDRAAMALVALGKHGTLRGSRLAARSEIGRAHV